MSSMLKPLKPLSNPANNIIGTPDLEKVLESYMNANTVADVGASADEQVIPAPAQPLETTHSVPVEPPASTRFQNFSIQDLENHSANLAGFVPIELDVRDIEARSDLTDDQKKQWIEERRKAVELQNYILKQKFDERVKYQKINEKNSAAWLDKITPQQADQDLVKFNERGIRQILASALLNANGEDDLKAITRVVEATASALTEGHTRSTQLEKFYQETQTLKTENSNLKKEVEVLRSANAQSQQAFKHQTSIVAPVKTLQTPQPAQNDSLKLQLQQLDAYGKTVFQGYLQQGVDPVSALKYSSQSQSLATQHNYVSPDATFRDIYGNKVFENVKRVKTGL